MASDITSTPVNTQQAATGRAIVRTLHGLYEMMVWTSTSSHYPICFGTSKTGSYTPKQQKADVSGCLGAGPAFVPLPDGLSGYLIWVNSAKQINVSKAVSDGKTPANWSLSGKTTTIRSAATGGPTAALQMQNGQLVLTVIWQDSGAGSMVYSQINPSSPSTSPAVARLADSCLDAPSLVRLDSASFLAYTDTSGAFNLAVDPAGGVDFDFDHRFTTTAVGGKYGPAFVPLNRDQAYVFWGTGSGLSYQQMGINSDGDWQLNSYPGCSGTLTGIVPSAAPSAQVTNVVVDGVADRLILVAAPSAKASPANAVLVAGIVPNLTPLPLPQLQLVTS